MNYVEKIRRELAVSRPALATRAGARSDPGRGGLVDPGGLAAPAVTPDPLAQLAAAAHVIADGLEELAPRLEVVADFVLQAGSRQRRAGFLRCPGCPECAEPLPLLTGDV